MSLFDRLKNVFIEEEYVEEIEPEKEVKINEISNNSDTSKLLVNNVDSVSDRESLDANQNFKFPIIFEEDDFKEEKVKSKSINVLERENTKYEPEIKNEVKKDKKIFKPSPVISPVYGVLDKNYSKDDITSKNGLLTDLDEKVDIDYVIKKAYGNNDEVDKDLSLFTTKTGEMDKLDEKIKSIDDILGDTTNDDFYSLVDKMYKEDE